jgi:TM2 domain-containing membrane protein YozV
MRKILLVFLFFIPAFAMHANEKFPALKTGLYSDTNNVDSLAKHHAKFFPKEENKKLIAAILAFPVPFGFIGLHRIYLGTEPWVPVVYLITGGGGALVLPLLDFIAIVTATPEQLKSYENNAKIFMWAK